MYIISMTYDGVQVYCGSNCTTIINNGYVHTTDTSTIRHLNKRKIDLIFHGTLHTLFTTFKKEIYSWGSNGNGRLGLGDKKDRDTPQKIKFDFGSDIALITGTNFHTLVVTKLGEIYGWGDNYTGSKGLGNYINHNVPHKLPIKDVRAVSCGWDHIIILTSNGCFGYGANDDGQLGLGNSMDQNSLQRIKFGSEEKTCPQLISCGWYHTVALIEGHLYSWGKNTRGQLGLGDSQTQYVPKKNNLLDYSVTSCIVSISCGVYFTMVLTSQGQLFVCGANNCGQLGLGVSSGRVDILSFKRLNLNEKILSVKCGLAHTIIITKSGEYYGCGSNEMGQLNLGDTDDRSEPTKFIIKM